MPSTNTTSSSKTRPSYTTQRNHHSRDHLGITSLKPPPAGVLREMPDMLEPVSQDLGSPEKRTYAEKQSKTTYITETSAKRKTLLPGRIKTATAYVAGGASAAVLSKLPSRAMLSSNGADGCRYCHGNANADPDCVLLWTERARAELLLRLGWGQKLPPAFGDSMNSLAHFLDPLPIPQILKEPPPLLVLLGTCATLTFTITYLRYKNRKDRYQDWIIGGSMVAAILLGFISDDCLIQATTLIPWAVMLGLLFSSLVHRALGLKLKSDEDD